jgi:hypothetical protein
MSIAEAMHSVFIPFSFHIFFGKRRSLPCQGVQSLEITK